MLTQRLSDAHPHLTFRHAETSAVPGWVLTWVEPASPSGEKGMGNLYYGDSVDFLGLKKLP